MFAAVFRTQWQASRTAFLLLAVAGFATPLLCVQGAGFQAGGRRAWDLVNMLATIEAYGVLFPTVAMVLGLALSVTAWSADHQGGHVYALTLPVPRWYYVLLRFAAGAILLVPATLAVGLGCVIAISTVDLPEGLRSYAGAVTLRFAFAALFGYAMTFALAAGTKRTAGLVIALLIAVVAALMVADTAGFDQTERLIMTIFEGPGPFAILGGPWMLIGV